MKEIEQMLKQWFPVNTVIRDKFRKLIIKAIENAENETPQR